MKHWVRHCLRLLWLITLAPLVVFTEPITATLLTSAFWVSLAVSAAATAAEFAVSYLLRPKPKPIDKDKMSGDIKVTSVGENVTIPEIYGGRLEDELGGFQIGGVIVWASPVTLQVTTVPGASGGKGAPRAPANKVHKYYQSYAILVGRGPLNVLQIKANTDTIWSNPALTPVVGVTYEAENGVLAGGAYNQFLGSPINKNVVSGIGGTGTATINTIAVADTGTYEVHIFYHCPSAQDYLISVTVNGYQVADVPLTYAGNVISHARTHLEFQSGISNIVEFSYPTTTADIDKIVVGGMELECGPGDEKCYEADKQDKSANIYGWETMVSGAQMPDYVNPMPTYDNVTLIDPTEADKRSLTEFNYQPQISATTGSQATSAIGMEHLWIEAGNDTQPPNEMMQAYFATKYGSADATPAYRNRCMIYIQKMEITKFSGMMPNFVVTAEHATIRSVGEMINTRALRAGVDQSEINVTALNAIPLRGYAITQKQSPRTEIDVLSKVFDFDMYENLDGVITGVLPTESVAYQIPISELDVVEGFDAARPVTDLASPVETVFRDEYQLDKAFNVSFFDVSNQYETASVEVKKEYTTSSRVSTYDTQMSMTKLEAQQLADRELQRQYAEKDALKISTFHKHAQIVPTQLIEVEELDGSFTKMRVKAVDGWIPGKLEITGVTRNVTEIAPRPGTAATSGDTQFYMNRTGKEKVGVRPPIPAHLVGTIIDVASLRTSEYETGVYIAACQTNPMFRWKTGALYVEKTGGYELLSTIEVPAIMGRTISGADGILGASGAGGSGKGYDDGATVTLDLYWGELDSKTQSEVEDNANVILIGNEVCRFVTATRVADYGNRWTLTGVFRRDRGTIAEDHVENERVVLMTTAVKWVPMDGQAEYGVTRNYKFVGDGQPVSSASSISFTYQGNTTQMSNRARMSTTNETVTPADGFLSIDATAGNRTVTLPDALLAYGHEPFTVKKMDDSIHYVRVQGTGGQTIDGDAHFDLLYQYESIDLVAHEDGTWSIK